MSQIFFAQIFMKIGISPNLHKTNAQPDSLHLFYLNEVLFAQTLHL